jgi:hypothetical protein
MTEPTEQPPDPAAPVEWIVADHKGLESCIQYLGKGKWVAWTNPMLKVGDILVSQMGRFVVTITAEGAEPNQVFATAASGGGI